MITNSGLKILMDLFVAGTSAHITTMNLGSGTSTPIFTDTSLQYEYFRSGVTFVPLGSPLAGNTFKMEVNSVQAYNLTATTEAGLNTATSTGSQFNRATFTAINLDNGSNWLFEWDVAHRDGNV